jgi:hypothetical protein
MRFFIKRFNFNFYSKDFYFRDSKLCSSIWNLLILDLPIYLMALPFFHYLSRNSFVWFWKYYRKTQLSLKEMLIVLTFSEKVRLCQKFLKHVDSSRVGDVDNLCFSIWNHLFLTLKSWSKGGEISDRITLKWIPFKSVQYNPRGKFPRFPR